MHHTRDLGLGFRFDRETVAPVTHSDHGILQIASGGRVVDHIVHLCTDLIVHSAHGAPDRVQRAAGVVGNLVLGENTAPDLVIQRCERFDAGKKTGQGIVRLIIVFL